ncbi:MAG TPA: cyanophycin synthetase [Planctomycetota bacterium]|nr:cyanophycin synthetase [Planctomycetota bacterium]
MPSAFDRAFRRLAALTDYETMATVPYHERTYGLARIDALLRDLGRPCARRPVIQVVGSKGKGTATAAAEAILRAAGVRTGSYFSPHLEHPSERILLDGSPVPGRDFARAVDRVLPLALRRAGGERPTFFELMTAVALLLFEEADCGAVVLEAGMGGRLDATTAPRRAAVLLTSVSLDHTAALGRTTAAIASEKAAAARRGVPFFSAVPAASPAGRAAARACRRAGAPLLLEGRDWTVARARTGLAGGRAETRFDLAVRGGPALRDLAMPLLGVHQARNAGLAAAALLRLARKGVVAVDGGAVRRGLAALRCPARLEVIRTRPLLVLDGAHNGASVRAAVRAVRAAAGPRGRLVVVFAANRDKDLRGMLRALRGASRLIATEVPNPRRAPAADLVRLARGAGLRASASGSPRTALAEALRAAGARGTVLVTGSMYLAGALSRYQPRRRDSSSAI